jgi:hypothetical protein
MVDIDSISDEYDLVSGFGKLFKVLTIFFAVATAAYTIYTLVKTEEVNLKPIPKYFVDNYTSENGESYQLNYQAVECNRADYNQNKKQSGSSADLNADEGKQWLAIYVSKNSMAGKPLTPDFKITETASAPGGMDGDIHTLGEKGAQNLTNADYMNYSKLYSGYKSVKDKIFGESKAYVFFKRSDIAKTYDESAGNMTATAMSGGTVALISFGCLVLGAALGSIVFALPCLFFSARVISSTMDVSGTLFEAYDEFDAEITTMELRIVCPGLEEYRVGRLNTYDVDSKQLVEEVVATVETSEELDKTQRAEVEGLVRLHVPDVDAVTFEVAGK